MLFESRPAYIVFVKDRFELVRANEITDEELAKAQSGPYADLPWTGPRIVGARIPKDPDEQFRAHDVRHGRGGHPVLSAVLRGVRRGEGRSPVASGAARPAARAQSGQSAAEIDRLVAKLGRPEAQLRFLPMRAGRYVDLTVLVDASRGDVLNIAALRPWEYK